MNLKRFYPLLCLLLVPLLLIGVLWQLGDFGLRQPDPDPAVLRSGAILSYLRDGDSFSLTDIYPEDWDTAQFASSVTELSSTEQRRLFGYDLQLTQLQGPLLILWQEGTPRKVIELPREADGYPRFQSIFNADEFTLSRQEAVFRCDFVPGESGRGGYYLCTPLGREA